MITISMCLLCYVVCVLFVLDMYLLFFCVFVWGGSIDNHHKLLHGSPYGELPDCGERSDGWHVGWHYLSNATLSNTGSFVVCVVCHVKDHVKLLNDLPYLKNTCVRQVGLDKWLPLNSYVYV